jgi:hypothetical protein
MVLRRVSGAAWQRTEGHPAARGALVLASGAAATLVGYIWWPNGDYRPIQPGEKGTIQGAVRQFAAVSSGRPALTQEREAALGGAPLLSSEQNTTKPATNVSTTQTETQTIETATDPSATVSTPVTTVEETVSTPTTTATTATTTTTPTTTTTTTTP